MKLNVFLNAYGRRDFVGVLDRQDTILFEYAPSFISKGLEISPFKLPLRSGIFEDPKRTFNGLFGVFNDSLPDGWGCLLLERSLQKGGLSLQSITPLHRLSMIGLNAMGALEYEPCDEDKDIWDNRIDLDSLSMEADMILQGESSAVLDELLSLNGSSCGARPKIVALVSQDKKTLIHGNLAVDGFEPWIIKFASSLDSKDIGAIEYIYSIMAKDAGVQMPQTYLFDSRSCGGHFGVKRFDRAGDKKIHVHTACGLLHAGHRYSSLDYESLIKLTSILTKDIRETEKMVRLMVFNVKSGNKDDHSKNFSFLMDESGKWKMSPAYDITPSQGINGEQTALVNGKGKNITDADLIKTASISSLPAAKIREIIEQTNDAFAQYPRLAKQWGVSAN